MEAVCGVEGPSGGVVAAFAAVVVETVAAAVTTDIAATVLVVPAELVLAVVESGPQHCNGAGVGETGYHRLDGVLVASYPMLQLLQLQLDYNLVV